MTTTHKTSPGMIAQSPTASLSLLSTLQQVALVRAHSPATRLVPHPSPWASPHTGDPARNDSTTPSSQAPHLQGKLHGHARTSVLHQLQKRIPDDCSCTLCTTSTTNPPMSHTLQMHVQKKDAHCKTQLQPSFLHSDAAPACCGGATVIIVLHSPQPGPALDSSGACPTNPAQPSPGSRSSAQWGCGY